MFIFIFSKCLIKSKAFWKMNKEVRRTALTDLLADSFYFHFILKSVRRGGACCHTAVSHTWGNEMLGLALMEPSCDPSFYAGEKKAQYNTRVHMLYIISHCQNDSFEENGKEPKEKWEASVGNVRCVAARQLLYAGLHECGEAAEEVCCCDTTI